jgi:hypothetical protein
MNKLFAARCCVLVFFTNPPLLLLNSYFTATYMINRETNIAI